jgi:hypothetical protein
MKSGQLAIGSKNVKRAIKGSFRMSSRAGGSNEAAAEREEGLVDVVARS